MTECVLATHGLTKYYGHTKAVDSVDLTVRRGEIYGLIGRNGAGKTTIIRMTAGQTLPTEGELTLFGETTPAGLSKARGPRERWWRSPVFIPICLPERIWNTIVFNGESRGVKWWTRRWNMWGCTKWERRNSKLFPWA